MPSLSKKAAERVAEEAKSFKNDLKNLESKYWVVFDEDDISVGYRGIRVN